MLVINHSFCVSAKYEYTTNCLLYFGSGNPPENITGECRDFVSRKVDPPFKQLKSVSRPKKRKKKKGKERKKKKQEKHGMHALA